MHNIVPIIFFFVSLSFGLMVGDFAPTKIGTEWKYNYTNHYRSSMSEESWDTLQIDIAIQGKHINNSDTIMLLHTAIQGRRIDSIVNKIIFDSIVNHSFIDTVFISGDSIVKPQNYKGIVFPFWKSHFINDTCLTRILFNNDSIVSYRDNTNYSSYYGKDYGLYSAWYLHNGNTETEFENLLVFFNGKKILTNVAYSEKPKKNVKSFQSGISTSVFHDVIIFHIPDGGDRLDIFDIEGRCIAKIPVFQNIATWQKKTNKGTFFIRSNSGYSKALSVIVAR